MKIYSLQSLVISGNRISKLPEDLNRMFRLEKLDLRLNPIFGSLPEAISLMGNLSQVTTPLLFSVVLIMMCLFSQLDITHTELERFDSNKTPALQLLACNSTSIQVLSLDDNVTSHSSAHTIQCVIMIDL